MSDEHKIHTDHPMNTVKAAAIPQLSMTVTPITCTMVIYTVYTMVISTNMRS